MNMTVCSTTGNTPCPNANLQTDDAISADSDRQAELIAYYSNAEKEVPSDSPPMHKAWAGPAAAYSVEASVVVGVGLLALAGVLPALNSRSETDPAKTDAFDDPGRYAHPATPPKTPEVDIPEESEETPPPADPAKWQTSPFIYRLQTKQDPPATPDSSQDLRPKATDEDAKPPQEAATPVKPSEASPEQKVEQAKQDVTDLKDALSKHVQKFGVDDEYFRLNREVVRALDRRDQAIRAAAGDPAPRQAPAKPLAPTPSQEQAEPKKSEFADELETLRLSVKMADAFIKRHKDDPAVHFETQRMTMLRMQHEQRIEEIERLLANPE